MRNFKCLGIALFLSVLAVSVYSQDADTLKIEFEKFSNALAASEKNKIDSLVQALPGGYFMIGGYPTNSYKEVEYCWQKLNTTYSYLKNQDVNTGHIGFQQMGGDDIGYIYIVYARQPLVFEHEHLWEEPHPDLFEKHKE